MVVLVANAAAAGLGSVCWLRSRPRLSLTFWPLLRVAQAAVAVQVVIGLLLLASGEHSPDGLHIVYGISPLVITLVSEAMRAGVAERELDRAGDLDSLDRREQVALAQRVALGEVAVMTVGALLVLTLALRAFQTGG